VRVDLARAIHSQSPALGSAFLPALWPRLSLLNFVRGQSLGRVMTTHSVLFALDWQHKTVAISGVALTSETSNAHSTLSNHCPAFN
jgi:hypothetical protein